MSRGALKSVPAQAQAEREADARRKREARAAARATAACVEPSAPASSDVVARLLDAIENLVAANVRMVDAIAGHFRTSEMSGRTSGGRPEMSGRTSGASGARPDVSGALDADGARAPRAPAHARPSGSRISSESQAFYQDPGGGGESVQDRNGAGAHADASNVRPDVRSVRDVSGRTSAGRPEMSGARPDASTQDRNGPLDSDTFATTTSIRKSISERPEKLGPPEGLAVMPSITKTVPPIFDEPKIEAERARQRRALEEFESADRKGAR